MSNSEAMRLTSKQITGIVIITCVFAILFGGTVYEHGWVAALISWGMAIVLASCTILGIKLIVE